MINQIIQRLRTEVAFCDPADHLDIAQTTRAALDVGFELVGGVVVSMMPADLLLALLGEELGRRPDIVRRNRLVHRVIKRVGALQQPRLHQAGCHCQVLFRLVATLFDRPHAVADLQTHVPQVRHKGGQRGGVLIGQFTGEEDENVHVRVWVEVTAAVACNGHQG